MTEAVKGLPLTGRRVWGRMSGERLTTELMYQSGGIKVLKCKKLQ